MIFDILASEKQSVKHADPSLFRNLELPQLVQVVGFVHEIQLGIVL